MTKLSRQTQLRLDQEKKRKQQLYLLLGGGALAVVLVLAGTFFVLNPRRNLPTSTGSAKCNSVQQIPAESSGHLNPGEATPVYKSAPPTSGMMDAVPLPAGAYGADVQISRLMHSLEHAYIVLYYNGLSQDQVQQLVNIQQSDSYKVIVAPYANMPSQVALAGWTRLQTCDGVNEQAIRSFIAQFRGQGPEPSGQ